MIPSTLSSKGCKYWLQLQVSLLKLTLIIVDFIFILTEDDWVSAMNKESSSLHILNPTGFEIQLFKSIVKDDAYLPRYYSVLH